MTIKHSPEIIQEALYAIFHEGFDFTLNEQTGNFFYDPWTLKEKYKGTVWQTIMDSLPFQVGEAKVRKLNASESYIAHADIDDRYHLNISGEKCYIINIQDEKMYCTINDGYWYDMNAGIKHTAANFGNRVRFQLVVRKLLLKNKLVNPVSVVIESIITDASESRYIFDDKISSWLNSANKRQIITDFEYENDCIKFKVEEKFLIDLKNIIPPEFKIYENSCW